MCGPRKHSVTAQRASARRAPVVGAEPVAGAAGVELSTTLASLREKDILLPGDRRDPAGESELAFKHVLIRDVAYEMLPKAARARRHAATIRNPPRQTV